MLEEYTSKWRWVCISVVCSDTQLRVADVVKDQGDVQASIQETLALLVDCFNDIDAARMAQLEALVLQNIEQVARLMSFQSLNLHATYVVYIVSLVGHLRKLHLLQYSFCDIVT